ncbi:hypothetical protein GCM10027402_23030 [Arthrobacter monumenti]
MPAVAQTALPPLDQQAERLIELGVHEVAGLRARDLHNLANVGSPAGALLVIHPGWAPASGLAPLLRRGGKRGFVVVDMPDVDDFAPIEKAALPEGPLYAVHGIDRGDQMVN